MSVGIRKTTLVWLGIGALMFGVAIWLTDMLTRLEPDPIANNTYSPTRMPFQMAAVFTRTPVDPQTGYDYTVAYSELPDAAQARITFFVHPADEPIILISSHTDPPVCYLVDEFQGVDPPREESLGAQILDDPDNHQKVYRLNATWPANYEQIVRCYVPSLSHAESFTGRAADFYFNSSLPPDAAGFTPAPRLIYRFTGITQARDMGFRGGVELGDDYDARETSRYLDAGKLMTVRWEQAGRQSLRDTLLIVIGTLIGIGVTVLIEAVKPYLELLDRTRKPHGVETIASPPSPPPPPAPPTS